MISVPAGRVAIRYIQDPKMTEGGIHLLNTERSDQGIVKYIGRGVEDIKVGDYVVFSGWQGTTVHISEEYSLIFMEEDKVECILHPPATEISGLYHRDREGNFFPATYESSIELIRQQYDDLPRFANLKNRGPNV